jgi:hypothetical protein
MEMVLRDESVLPKRSHCDRTVNGFTVSHNYVRRSVGYEYGSDGTNHLHSGVRSRWHAVFEAQSVDNDPAAMHLNHIAG